MGSGSGGWWRGGAVFLWKIREKGKGEGGVGVRVGAQAKEPASQCASFVETTFLANYPLVSPRNVRRVKKFGRLQSLDGPIRANRFARESPDSRESFRGSRAEHLFGESRFGGLKIANRSFEAIRANRWHVMKI